MSAARVLAKHVEWIRHHTMFEVLGAQVADIGRRAITGIGVEKIVLVLRIISAQRKPTFRGAIRPPLVARN